MTSAAGKSSGRPDNTAPKAASPPAEAARATTSKAAPRNCLKMTSCLLLSICCHSAGALDCVDLSPSVTPGFVRYPEAFWLRARGLAWQKMKSRHVADVMNGRLAAVE